MNKDNREADNIFLEFFKELGIDEKLLKKFVNFDMEQKNMIQSITDNTKDKIDVLNQNIFSFRGILITITGFSLTIIGALLTVIISNSYLFNNIYLLYIGIVSFALNIIISILFILNVYHFENNKLSEQIKFNNKLINNFSDLIARHLKNANYESYLKEKSEYKSKMQNEEQKIANEKNKHGLLIGEKDYTAHLSIALFLAGFILVLLSFLKI